MGLGEYRRRRDFKATPEPSEGAVATPEQRKHGLSYVIQRHDARQLHFDFRLELDGVLKSWAVPKGPSLDPAEKRLAVQTEDHPIAYGGFEGTIPAGQYGAGKVLVWDRGSWQPRDDPRKGLRQGKLVFTLQGRKLRGRWALIKLKQSSRSSGAGEWLLIKEKDGHARASSRSAKRGSRKPS
jgi:bifunctional non-homologous end joining protein LigD